MYPPWRPGNADHFGNSLVAALLWGLLWVQPQICVDVPQGCSTNSGSQTSFLLLLSFRRSAPRCRCQSRPRVSRVGQPAKLPSDPRDQGSVLTKYVGWISSPTDHPRFWPFTKGLDPTSELPAGGLLFLDSRSTGCCSTAGLALG